MFRFTIRDFVWLVVVVAVVAAMGSAWYVDRTMAWVRGYELNLRLEVAEWDVKELNEGIETLPDEQRKQIIEHLRKRRPNYSEETTPTLPGEAGNTNGITPNSPSQ